MWMKIYNYLLAVPDYSGKRKVTVCQEKDNLVYTAQGSVGPRHWALGCYVRLGKAWWDLPTMAYRGWGGGAPPQIPKALQNRAKLNPIVKSV